MRKLSNWLESYLEYTEETESSPIFHKWVGISCLAAALRKKTWLTLGRIKVFPNMYIVLVAEPGIARKSQAISYGVDLLGEVPSIVMSADSTTSQALIQDLEIAAMDDQMPDGRIYKHSSLSIISREFESFLGQKGENIKMLVLLTDLFDASEKPWKYKTKNSGMNTIPSVYINLLGATTPDSLANCLPSSAIGGGLTSRILFVWSNIKTKKIPRPVNSPRVIELRELLIHDLNIISRIAGAYQFTEESGQLWDKWYLNYDETSTKRQCTDPAFNGWYSRKPMMIQKLALVSAASRQSKLVVEWENFEEAIKLVEEVESAMGKTFTSIGKSETAPETDKITQLLKLHKSISEKQLMHMTWRDLDASKFDNVMATVIRSGNCQRTYKSPDGVNGIWYSYTGE